MVGLYSVSIACGKSERSGGRVEAGNVDTNEWMGQCNLVHRHVLWLDLPLLYLVRLASACLWYYQIIAALNDTTHVDPVAELNHTFPPLRYDLSVHITFAESHDINITTQLRLPVHLIRSPYRLTSSTHKSLVCSGVARRRADHTGTAVAHAPTTDSQQHPSWLNLT
jgi:hypothetical protein